MALKIIDHGSPEYMQMVRMRDTILRTKFSELARNEERRKTQRLDISVETVAGLLPWREVVEPQTYAIGCTIKWKK